MSSMITKNGIQDAVELILEAPSRIPMIVHLNEVSYWEGLGKKEGIDFIVSVRLP